MSEIIIENVPDDVEKTTISFEEGPLADEFAELPVKDAEIISETPLKRVKEVENEVEPDDFTKFLLTLPDDSNPAIIITRQPDRNYAGQFRLACESQEHSGTLNWNNYTDASEIYNDIAKKFGGGRYSIQVKDGQRFEKNRTWTATVADPVSLSEKEKTLLELKTKSEENARNNESSQVFGNSTIEQDRQSLIRSAREEARAEREYIREEARKEREYMQSLIQPTQTTQTLQPEKTKSVETMIFEHILSSANEELKDKAVSAKLQIPPDNAETQGNIIVESIKFIASHPQETKAVLDIALSSVGTIFSNLMPKPPVVVPPNIVPNGLQRFKKPPQAQTPAPMPETPPEAKYEQINDDVPNITAVEIEPFPFIALEG